MRAVVVGSGVFGASAAYHLVRRGVEVILVDGAHPGQATAAGAGIVSPWVREIQSRAYYEFATAAAKYYETLIGHLHADDETNTGYRKVGSIALPQDEAELNAVYQRLVERQQESPEIGTLRLISPDEVGKLFAPIRRDLSGIYIEGTARVDGRLLANAIVAACLKRGVSYQRACVTELVVRSGRVVGVSCGDIIVESDIVVLTGGAWVQPLIAPLGLALAIEPQRGQIIHLRFSGGDTGRFPVIQPMNGYYMLGFDDSRIVVGATREFGVGFEYRTTAKGVSEVLDFALSYAPGLKDAELLETRIGFRPMAFDNRPMLGPVGSVEGLYIGNGLGHSGLSIGPYAGAILAKLCVGEEAGFDIEPFAPLRKPH